MVMRRLDFLLYNTTMAVMISCVVFWYRIMNSNHSTSPQELRPTAICLPYALSGLVTVEKKQIDGGAPGICHLRAASLMYLNPWVETSGAHVPLEMIAK